MNAEKYWHESDDFWETMAPKMFGERAWTSAPEYIENLVRLLDLHPGEAVLDMCCGPGRHSLELTRRGFKVTGVDRTSAYLEMARKRTAEEDLDVEYVEEDMRKFCRPDSFDAATLLYTSFGYFEDQDENRQVLVNIHKSLKNGGKLVVDLMGKEILARIFRERDWFERDGVIFLEDRKVTRNWTWMENNWIMIRGAKRYEFRLTHWIYSAAEIEALLRQSGFKMVEIYGNITGD
ncbi:MAG: class I SAM-dependent methyltransferase, partial [Anaerolineaceae bacterium]|nr:class I SAM-dependent methyltransferase [Anaerolineaceae bacterium]